VQYFARQHPEIGLLVESPVAAATAPGR
jgi:hypothetical protein